MRRYLARGLCTLCLLGSWLGSARAQPTPPADDPNDREARSNFEAGTTAHAAGRFEDALGYFERAYALSPRPRLLYNIGTTAAALQRADRAIEAFEQFLREEPDTERREEVEGRIRALREAQAGRPVDPPPEEPGPVEGTDPGGPGLAPWIVVGASGAAVITGGVLFVLGLGANSDVESVPEGTRWTATEGDYDRGKLFTTLGLVIGAVGIAGVAGGLVWTFSAGGSTERAPEAGGSVEARLRIGPGGLEIEARF